MAAESQHAAGDHAQPWSTSSSMFPTPSREGLPPPPAPYEDFNPYSNFPSFDYEPYPPSAPTSANPFSYFNPFSPTGMTPPYPAHSRSNSAHYPSSLSPPSNHPPGSPPMAVPLFAPAESEAFTSFLDTLDVDSTFLFNPVLPPGMPSPPPALPTREEITEREILGQHVGSMSLGNSSSAGGKRGSEETVVVKEEPQEDDSTTIPKNGEGVVMSPQAGSSRAKSVEAGSRAKKIKVSPEDNETDIDMAGGAAEDDSSATATATTTAPAPRRRPSVRPPTNGRTRRVATKSRPSAADNSASPGSASSPGDEDGGASNSPDFAAMQDRKIPLTEAQKRENHILSEQRRRNAIRSGFKDLVDLLSRGESASGIVVAPPEPEEDPSGKKKKGKGTGRGRGRKGEVGAGASKSVVLEKAVAYIKWLERGNEGLDKEVNRVEMLLGIGGR